MQPGAFSSIVINTGEELKTETQYEGWFMEQRVLVI